MLLQQDPSNPELLTEWFLVESWAKHLRQHQRVHRADAELQRGVIGFHVGAKAPRVRHMLGLSLP
ncbi:MFS transporter [Cupriavidus sp. IDO]|uniref:MFS transporter n=1 Tax=Cupriavidus sp. IDO TaxID=1539142 RepID=UPI003FCC5018